MIIRTDPLRAACVAGTGPDKTLPMRHVKLLALGGALGAVLFSFACRPTHPSDAALIDVLTNKFTTLSNVVVFLKAAPSIDRLEWDGKKLRVNDKSAKVADYQELQNLCAKIDRPVLIAKHGHGSQILFYFSTIGNV